MFSKRVSKIKPSATLEITAKAKELKAKGVDIISLSAGEPDFDTPDYIKNAAVNALKKGYTKYTVVSGIQELKESVVNKLMIENNLEYEPLDIVISCGAKHALYNVSQALFDEGDEIIIPSPFWVSYIDQVVLSGALPVCIRTREEDGFILTPEIFKKTITPKTKAIFLNSPNNPTGTAYAKKDLEAIAEIAVKNNIIVISDEIYEYIVYDDFKHVSIASLGKEIKDLTVTINGFSKAYSMTGWRVGYSACKKEIAKKLSIIQSQSTSNATSFAQYACIEALRGDKEFTYMMVREFTKRRNYIVNRLNSMQGVTCFNPNGSFYVFPSISSYYGKAAGNNKPLENTIEMTDYLLNEAKVAVVPGIAFGFDENIRISFATSMEQIKKGCERIEEALGRLS